MRLIQPSFHYADPSGRILSIDDFVRDESGDSFYNNTSHGLQLTNIETTWELFTRSGLVMLHGAWGDFGCGDAIFNSFVTYNTNNYEAESRVIIGVDVSPKKVQKARHAIQLLSHNYEMAHRLKDPESQRTLGNYHILDPVSLTELNRSKFQVDGKPIRVPELAAIFTHSVMHWIREDKDKILAFENFNQLLKKGGIFCMSMSAGGTAEDFLQAYNEVLDRRGLYDIEHRRDGYRPMLRETDPVGSQQLNHIVNMVISCGFDVHIATDMRESITYPNPKQYSAAVRIYGWDQFTRPFPHYSKSQKEALWKDIEKRFLEILKEKGWHEGNPWTYSQYNIYIIARKRGENIPIPLERYPINPAFLNPEMLNRSYSRKFKDYRQQIGGVERGLQQVEVNGTQEIPSDIRVPVDVSKILDPIILHAAKHWQTANAGSEKLKIQYTLQQGTQGTRLQCTIAAYVQDELKFSAFPEVIRAHDKRGLIDIKLSHVSNGLSTYRISIPVLN